MFIHMSPDIVTNLGFDVEAAGGRKEIHSEFCGGNHLENGDMEIDVFTEDDDSVLGRRGRTDSWSCPMCGLWHGYCGILEVYHGSGGYLVTLFPFCDCESTV